VLNFHRFYPDQTANVAVLTLNRPESANALDDEIIGEVTRAVAEVKTNVDCRALFIRGAGKNFCAGGDLNQMRASINLTPEENRQDAANFSKLFESIARLEIPTVAVVHGAAFGGGVGLTACCDWAIATDDSRFCLSEMRLGLVAGIIFPYLKPKLKLADLKRWIVTGRIFSAEEALRAGLVHKVVQKSELGSAVREELVLILTGAPLVQRDLKTRLLETAEKGELSFSESLKESVDILARVRTAPEAQEGILAFLENRRADWSVTLPADWKIPEFDV
jgi:methylglutaconyl-CoA hydratase